MPSWIHSDQASITADENVSCVQRGSISYYNWHVFDPRPRLATIDLSVKDVPCFSNFVLHSASADRPATIHMSVMQMVSSFAATKSGLRKYFFNGAVGFIRISRAVLEVREASQRTSWVAVQLCEIWPPDSIARLVRSAIGILHPRYLRAFVDSRTYATKLPEDTIMKVPHPTNPTIADLCCPSVACRRISGEFRSLQFPESHRTTLLPNQCNTSHSEVFFRCSYYQE